MKNKFLKSLIKFFVLVLIIVLILMFSNVLYNVALKYNIVKEAEDTINTKDTSDTIQTVEVNNEDDIQTILNKFYPIGTNSKYINNFFSKYNGVEAYINGEEVTIILRSEASEYFSGLISNAHFDGGTSIRANVSSKKQIKTLLVGYYLDVLSSEFMQDVPYVFFLMEDGTIEYIDIKILLKNGYFTNPATTVKTRGTVKGLSNIVKLEQVNLANEEEGYSTAVAIDKDGQIYNLFDYIKWGE